MESNCYECKYRGSVPGDGHSCCRHPDLGGITAGNPIEKLIDSLSGASVIQKAGTKFKLKANPHGVKKGWFLWPFNFDPIWLENCDGFEDKTK